MKILYVISSFGIGGEQRVTSILTKEFVNKGIAIDLLVFGEKKEKSFSLESGVNISYCGIKDTDRFSKTKKVKAVRKRITVEKYDLILAFAVIPSIVCCAAAIGLNIPVVISERNDPKSYSKFYDYSRRILYPKCTAAVFQTNDAKDCFPYLKNARVRVIPNPLDTSKLPDVYRGERRKRIVNTARLTSVKNQIVLIKAFEQLKSKYSDYTIAIYGDGKEKESLNKYIENHNLEDRVFIKPAVTNILEEIREDAIFVLPSKNEGFPNSLVEALALGIPSISTDCRIGGPADMLLGKNRGILVKVDSVEELTAAIDQLLSNADLMKIYSENSIAIREELSSEIIADKWIKLFNDILHK